MLYLTNGYSGVDAIRAAAVEGDVVPWRDVLHEGPVPALPAAELRALRAEFLSGMGWGDRDAILADLGARDERLDRALDRREDVMLVFENDLYDVLQIVEILARVEEPSARLKLVLVGEHTHQALIRRNAATLRHDLARARPVARGVIDAARRLYSAFRAPRPDRMHEALAAAGGLPGGREASRRLLENLPWVTDDLTRSERQLLQAVADGHGSRPDAFAASQRAEPRPFLGDLTAFAYLDRMAPLVTGEPLVLTDYGRAVLEGRARWDDRPPFHLGGAVVGPWRWDPAGGRVTVRR